MSSLYRAWDGSQDPLGERPDVGDLLEQISHDILHGFGGRDAIRRMLREGVQGRRGLDDLRRRLRDRREQLRRETDPDGVLDDYREALDEVLDVERDELDGRDDDAATFARMSLDALPSDLGGQLRALQDHDWVSEDAAALFEHLMDRIRADLLEQYLKGISGAMERITPEDVAALTEMLGDLNELLAKRASGADTQADFDAFMAKHGAHFPSNPATLDELLQEMARRAQAMARLLQQMSPEQRRQLADLANAVFDDLDLELQLGQLGDNLGRVLPTLPGWDGGEGTGWGQGDGEGGDGFGVPDRPGPGGQDLPLSMALDAMERVGELDELEEQLRGDYAGATLEDVDTDALRRHLGQDAVRDLRELRAIERSLEDAGVLRNEGGELTLTARGARILGERALTSLLDRIRRQPAQRVRGTEEEQTGQHRQWAWGDREPIAAGPTLRNAVLRQAATGWRAGQGAGPLRLSVDDLAVAETEVRPRTATALLLDLSYSMPLQGHFVPAKRMVLALHALIEGKHRQDSLHLVGFSDYARRMQPKDLGMTGFERVYGTNMHHAFLLARRLLMDDPRPVKQVIMVTDGEPTAHLEHGRAWFNYPPIRETLEATLREAMRLARAGIALNIFLLEDAPGLVAFAQRLAQLTGGQVFQMSAEELGPTIIGSY